MDMVVEPQIKKSHSLKPSAAAIIVPALAPVAQSLKSETILERRFQAPLRPALPEVTYEFTKDPGLLSQYYYLREQMYRKVFKTDKFVGEEDLYDKASQILVARRGNLCIGGCRVTIREATEQFMLPLECPDFKLRKVFPEVPLNDERHGEISRFAVQDEDDDKMGVMLALSKAIIQECVNAGLGYVFLKSSLPMARNWRKIIRTNCGQDDVRIHTDVKVPDMPIHPDIIWYITQVSLVKSSVVAKADHSHSEMM